MTWQLTLFLRYRLVYSSTALSGCAGVLFELVGFGNVFLKNQRCPTKLSETLWHL